MIDMSLRKLEQIRTMTVMMPPMLPNMHMRRGGATRFDDLA